VDDNKLKGSGRRRFLGKVGAAGAATTAGLLGMRSVTAAEGNLPPGIPQWTREQGRTFLSPPYGLPSPFEKHVVRVLPDGVNPFPTGTRTPLQHLKGSVTPNGLFFERHHAGVPMIDPREHRLMVHGMVERPLLFTVDELMRFPSVNRVHFIECSGNSAAEWGRPAGRTAQEVHGLVSNAEWTGVPLSVVLR
jgi:sulfane dehydrogenase subunit SoxC